MRIAVGCDHAGFPLKQTVADELRRLGHDVVDLGAGSAERPVDYPDISEAVAGALVAGDADRAVLICGSGVGASVAANKVRGIRAAVCHDTYSAGQGVEHDDMNVLTLGARVIGPALATDLVRAFVEAKFSGDERHVRRVGKIGAIEERFNAVKENVNG
jgi:ribose 5-phosphate isomerase B